MRKTKYVKNTEYFVKKGFFLAISLLICFSISAQQNGTSTADIASNFIQVSIKIDSMPLSAEAYLLPQTELPIDIAAVYNYGADDRDYTIKLLQKIADSVLVPLSENNLHKSIPTKDWETKENKAANLHTSALQAFGRTLSGIAPWLSLGANDSPEGKLREKYISIAQKSLINAINPESLDYMFKNPTHEFIVHIAFIAYPLLIAPKQLLDPLNASQKVMLVNALKMHREFKPYEKNWLLFSSVIESVIWKITGECEMSHIEYAVNKHMDWFLGDGIYGDGPNFYWDYYNSYVIQPFLLETLRVCKEMGSPLAEFLPESIVRGQRYSEILEHLISPEGTFPAIGRSSVYRIAVFQLLEYMAFRWEKLPESLNPGATRAALTTVIKRMMDAPGTFDKDDWLTAGIVGEQLNARDDYNYTGSLYMCAIGLMHLGMPADSPFWTQKAEKWTQQRIWSGEDLPSQDVFK